MRSWPITGPRRGRGRLGRGWWRRPAPRCCCSVLLEPDLGPGQLHLATWAVALAAVRACRVTAGVELSLKWPNDLVAEPAGAPDVDEPAGTGDEPAGAGDVGAATGAGARHRPGHLKGERKVAGILSEIVPARTHDPAGSGGRRHGGIVVGIGINVNWPAGWPPEGSKDPDLAAISSGATSLNRLAGREIDRDELVRELLATTGTLSAMLADEEGRRAVASQYRRACTTIGREVRVELSGETVRGRALDLDDSGCLLVSTGACIRTISAGDVVHVR